MPHPPSTRRAASNRTNARRSTGPVTAAGKDRARFNAFRHGLTGQTVLLPWEDHEAFAQARQAFFDDLHPQGALETQLVETIADCSWRLNRAAALETNFFALSIERFSNAIDTGDARADAALAMAASLSHDEGRMLASMSMYTQRISRQRERAVEQLLKLQANRRTQPEPPAQAASAHTAAPAAEPTANLPVGFVFSNRESASPPASAIHLVSPLEPAQPPDAAKTTEPAHPSPSNSAGQS